MALLRQVLVAGYLTKDIETHGIVKITDKGLDL
jgi:ATP-dependent DNA helicase RecQ